jgi:hypothetical protein
MHIPRTLPSRRSLLRMAGLGLPLAGLARANLVHAAADPTSINVEYGQRIGTFPRVPSERDTPIAWPIVADDFPDPRGLLSEDRTEVLLADPGVYLITSTFTFEPGGGTVRKVWFEGTTPEGEWHAVGDGNEVPPVSGGRETTLVATLWLRSDGKLRIRLLAYHDSGGALKISDRPYECHLHVSYWSP